MTLYANVMRELERYYTGRNIEALKKAIQLIESEIADPSLQETVIQLTKLTSKEVNKQLTEKGCLKIPNDDGDATGPVAEGKFIRVMALGQDDGCTVLQVGHVSPECTLLFVMGANPDASPDEG